MYGTLIAGAAALGTSLWNGIAGAKANKKQRAELERQQNLNRSWFDREYNTDVTQRADAQRMLTRTADALKVQNRAATARNAMIGGSAESLMAQRANNARILGDTAANIAAQGANRKDMIDQQYRAQRQQLDNAAMGMEAQRQQSTAAATAGAIQSLTSMGTIFDDALAARNENKEEKKK